MRSLKQGIGNTQTGYFNCAGPELYNNGTTGRTHYSRRRFWKPYKTVPLVFAFVTELRSPYKGSDTNYRVDVFDVSTTNFTIRCAVNDDSQINYMIVRWVSFQYHMMSQVRGFW